MAESALLRQWIAEGGMAVRYATLQLSSPNFSKDHYLLDAGPESEGLVAGLETSQLVEFMPAPLDIKLPEVGVQGRESMRIVLHGVTTEVIQELDAQSQGVRHPITATFREYLSADLSYPQNVLRLTLKNPTLSGGKISAEATYQEAINLVFPSINYNSSTHPGLNA